MSTDESLGAAGLRDTDEFQQLWKAYDVKLQRSLKLNQQLLEEIHSRKVRTSFNWQIFAKLMLIGLAVGWNILLGSLLWAFHTNPVFAAAAGLIILFTSYGIAGYVMQLLLMVYINMSKSILETQKHLARLEAAIVWTLRISFFQAPVWPFLFVPAVLPAGVAHLYWTILILVTIALAVPAIWLYRRITVAGAQQGWVKKMVDNEGGKAIARARGFIKEIEDYRREEE